MKLRVTLPLLSLLLSSAINSSAENGYSLNDTIPLNEVKVVSATKTEVSRNQIPLTISVVNQKTLEESTETGLLSVLSEEVPGLFVTERGVTGYGISNGSAGSVSIHGVGGGNKVLMLFDGQPMWAAIFGHSIPDSYVASDAERVEIIRGPGSLLYGTNAMGGVINVITKKAKEDGIHGRGRVMYGSYNTQKYMGSAGYKKDKFNVFASLNHDRTDGQRDNSEFYITNGYVRLGYELSDNWDVSGNAIIADFKTTNPGRIETPMFENWAEALRSTYSVAINNKYDKMSGSLSCSAPMITIWELLCSSLSVCLKGMPAFDWNTTKYTVMNGYHKEVLPIVSTIKLLSKHLHPRGFAVRISANCIFPIYLIQKQIRI